jgi:hypothetical protein
MCKLETKNGFNRSKEGDTTSADRSFFVFVNETRKTNKGKDTTFSLKHE